MKKLCFFSLFYLLCFINLFSQNKETVELYLETTGNEALILRGERPLSYRFVYSGTFYEEKEEFEKGDLWYNGLYYPNQLLNLNSHLNELYVKSNDLSKIVKLKSELIDSAKFGGYKYLNIKETEGHLQPGFYKILHRTSKCSVIKSVKKYYKEKIDQSSNSGMSVIKYFDPEIKYFFVKGKNVTEVRGRKGLLRLALISRQDYKKVYNEMGSDIFNVNYDVLYSRLMKYSKL